MTVRRAFFRLRSFLFLLKHFQWAEILHKLGRRVHSNDVYFGLESTLSTQEGANRTSLSLRLRPLQAEDISVLFDIHTPGLSRSEIRERVYRLQLIKSGIQSCYVAVTADGSPCAALWLIPASENSKIQDHSNGAFPLLSDNEALLEGLFTLESFRRMHVMEASVRMVLAKAKELQVSKVKVFVSHRNVHSVKLLQRAGFTTYTVKHEQRLLFSHSLSYHPISSPRDLSLVPANVEQHD